VTCNLTPFLCFVCRLTGGTRVKPNQEEAFLLWKREKDKLLKQKKLQQKVQKETLKSDNEKKAVADIVSCNSLKLIFPELWAESKISNTSNSKGTLWKNVYLGSHINLSCCWFHFNIIILIFQVVAFKEIYIPNCQNHQLVLHEDCRTSQINYLKLLL
jgi:hypothetical protein